MSGKFQDRGREEAAPARMVLIYLGQQYRGKEGLKNAWSYIGRAHTECLISTSMATGEYCRNKYGCDVACGVFLQNDDRADEFVTALNSLEGICAKIVPADPRTGNLLGSIDDATRG